jgi:hypothetical protein
MGNGWKIKKKTKSAFAYCESQNVGLNERIKQTLKTFVVVIVTRNSFYTAA